MKTIRLLSAAALMLAALLLGVVPGYAADKGGPRAAAAADDDSASAPRWTGPWIGAHLGYSKQTTELSGSWLGVFDGSYSEKEVTYGVGAGYDIKVPNTNFVLGAMLDIDFMNNEAVDWAAFAGGRAGVLISSSALVYALAGYTWSEGDAEALDKGLTIGAGIEMFVLKNASLKLEYRYIDLGDERISAGGILPTTAEGDVQTMRASLNYRF